MFRIKAYACTSRTFSVKIKVISHVSNASFLKIYFDKKKFPVQLQTSIFRSNTIIRSYIQVVQNVGNGRFAYQPYNNYKI